MKVLFLILLLSLAVSALAGEWSLPQTKKAIRENFACGAEIGAGPFKLDARLALGTLEGTAASVFFGKELNFGLSKKVNHFSSQPRVINSIVLRSSSMANRFGRLILWQVKLVESCSDHTAGRSIFSRSS